jgi:ribosomal protein L32E
LPYKDKEKQKEYNRSYGMKWYRKNRELALKRSKENRRRHREKWTEYKSSLSCKKCGFSHPAVIDFHHPDGHEIKVSDYVRNHQWKKAYAESKKCEVLCANCHRIHHYNQNYK